MHQFGGFKTRTSTSIAGGHSVCRSGFLDNLTLGGPTPIGARAANLTEMTRPFMEEVALNEQVGLSCRHI